MVRRWVVLLVMVAMVWGGGTLAYRLLVPDSGDAGGPVYATEPVVRGDISVGVDATGPLDPAEGGAIVAPGGWGPTGPIPGPSSYVVEEVLVQEGNAVQPGQILVRLSASELREQIRTKEEQLNADRQSLARLVGMSPENLGNVDPSRGITLRTPIPGRVMGLSVREGQALTQGQIVARVVDDSRFRVTAKLLPLEYQRVSVGQRMLLKFDEFDSFTEGVIVEMSPDPVPENAANLPDVLGEAGSQSGYVFVHWVTIEGQNRGLIRPGMDPIVAVASEQTSGSQTPASYFRYRAVVEGYAAEEQILCGATAVATRVYVKEMQRVNAGDAIVSLTGEDAQQAVTLLLDRVRQQEAELRQMVAQLDNLDIRATMEGIVATIEARPGMVVEPGRWMGHIFNTANMRMWVQVDDIDVLQVRVGAPVRITVDAVPNQTFAGEVEYVGMMGKDESGVTHFSVTIKVTGGPELRPGMQATAHIEGGSAEDALLVPLEAIFEEDGQAKVEVLLPNGITKVVPVDLGLMNDRVAEVKSGLAEGDQVITGSTADLLPSQTIESDGLLPGGSGSEPDTGSGSGPK